MKGKVGKKRWPIVVEQAVETKTASGHPQTTWQKFVERKARALTLRGREYFASREFNTEITIRFYVRGDSETKAITTKMRILHRGGIYNIKSILPDELERELEIMCTEDQNP